MNYDENDRKKVYKCLIYIIIHEDIGFLNYYIIDIVTKKRL